MPGQEGHMALNPPKQFEKGALHMSPDPEGLLPLDRIQAHWWEQYMDSAFVFL